MENTEALDDYGEHELRRLIEENDPNIMSHYDAVNNIWEVYIDQGWYRFCGKISPKGIPTEGVIIHNNEEVRFLNNQQLLNNSFRDTIISLFQYKMNEKIQEYYKKKKKDGKAYTASRYIHDRDIIQEEDGESSSEEEGNVIHEEPTQPTQQPQNQSNLNLKSNRNRKFGRGGNK